MDVFFFFPSSSIDKCALILFVCWFLDLVHCANCGKVIRETDLLCKSLFWSITFLGIWMPMIFFTVFLFFALDVWLDITIFGRFDVIELAMWAAIFPFFLSNILTFCWVYSLFLPQMISVGEKKEVHDFYISKNAKRCLISLLSTPYMVKRGKWLTTDQDTRSVLKEVHDFSGLYKVKSLNLSPYYAQTNS